MYLKYLLFALVAFVTTSSFGGGEAVYGACRNTDARTALASPVQSIQKKQQAPALDIEQCSLAQNMSPAHSGNQQHTARESSGRHLLLAHFLSYLHEPSNTTFTAISLERNNFFHLFPRLIIFPKHWFW